MIMTLISNMTTTQKQKTVCPRVMEAPLLSKSTGIMTQKMIYKMKNVVNVEMVHHLIEFCLLQWFSFSFGPPFMVFQQ